MERIQIQLNNEKAIGLLRELEELNLITLIQPRKKSIKSPGKISDKTAKALHRHVRKSRAEWERR